MRVEVRVPSPVRARDTNTTIPSLVPKTEFHATPLGRKLSFVAGVGLVLLPAGVALTIFAY